MDPLTAYSGLTPAVGVWDTVLIFGEYQHVTVDGKETVDCFDASRCRYTLADFEARKNDIFYDRQHAIVDVTKEDGTRLTLDEMDAWARGSSGQYGLGDSDGKALAWADALVMVVAGQVAKYARHSTAPETPPTIEELRRSDGSLPEDGVYARRAEVTPLGADPKEGLAVFRCTSPYYVRMPDGWRLLNLTVTNDPRMDGCALAYERGARVAMQRIVRPARTAMEQTNMDPKDSAVMTAAGCAESDSPEEKMAKMAAYARRMARAMDKAACMSRYQVWLEDYLIGEGDTEDAAWADAKAELNKQGEGQRLSAAKLRKMEADASQEKEAAAAARKAMEDAAAVKPPVAAEGGEDLEARIKALEEKNAMLLAELAQSKGAMQRFAAMEAKTKAQEAAEFARSAVAMGRIKGDHKGSIEATEKWLAERHVKNPADAEDLLSAEGTFQISERVAMSRLTQKGAGIGAPDPADAATSPADEVDRLVAAEIKSMQAAGEKGDLTTAAMSRVSKKHPAAWGRYVNRNRGA